MRSIKNLHTVLAGTMISSDDLVESHAARLLLLLLLCGTRESKTQLLQIDSLTKLAKLDFFVRYPAFLERVSKELNTSVERHPPTVESKMVRLHYGPWDERYYQILPYLEAHSLIEIKKHQSKKQYHFFLTIKGEELSQKLSSSNEFESLKKNMAEVNRVLSGKNGNELKNLVYKVFKKEVAERKLGEAIEP